MKLDKSYRQPVKDFLEEFGETLGITEAIISGGVVRDIVLGLEVKDVDVIISSRHSIDKIISHRHKMLELGLVFHDDYEANKANNFNTRFDLDIKDTVNNIDYLFIRKDKTIKQVIESFDCSLNKGTADILTGRITPPDLEKFEYCLKAGTPERMERFYNLFLNTCTVRFADDISNEPTIFPN